MNNWVVINRILPEIKFEASFQVDLVEKKLKLVPLEINLIQTTRLLHLKKSKTHHFRCWVKRFNLTSDTELDGIKIRQEKDGQKFGHKRGRSLDIK